MSTGTGVEIETKGYGDGINKMGTGMDMCPTNPILALYPFYQYMLQVRSIPDYSEF